MDAPGVGDVDRCTVGDGSGCVESDTVGIGAWVGSNGLTGSALVDVSAPQATTAIDRTAAEISSGQLHTYIFGILTR